MTSLTVVFNDQYNCRDIIQGLQKPKRGCLATLVYAAHSCLISYSMLRMKLVFHLEDDQREFCHADDEATLPHLFGYTSILEWLLMGREYYEFRTHSEIFLCQ